ncbi:hypothetical protein ACIRU2_34785 [Streptomyces sp. NPDC101169]|uniref:hypothetical protein n=1 Tax=Streptomyces sp. NPDC101169 TaxID=3366121 RepID=UPI003814E44C
MNTNQLHTQTAELLPAREALGKFSFNLTKLTTITKKTAHINAHNESAALNQCSPYATAQSETTQTINIHQ